VRQNTNSAQIEHREVSPLITSAEIRDALEERYPEVTDPEFNLEHTGIAHEHPLIAIGVVLISSIVLATTDPVRLMEYTKYSERFVRAVAANMQISGLWKNDKYDCSDWECGQLLPSLENRKFWDHVLIGEGSLWKCGTHSQLTRHTDVILWRDKLT
jgi:hypothetical protein